MKHWSKLYTKGKYWISQKLSLLRQPASRALLCSLLERFRILAYPEVKGKGKNPSVLYFLFDNKICTIILIFKYLFSCCILNLADIATPLLVTTSSATAPLMEIRGAPALWLTIHATIMYYYTYIHIYTYIYIFIFFSERETSICCSIYSCIHWLVFACALCGDWTHNLGVSGQHSNQLNYQPGLLLHVYPSCFLWNTFSQFFSSFITTLRFDNTSLYFLLAYICTFNFSTSQKDR